MFRTRKLHRLAELSPTDRALYLTAWLLLWRVRLMLWLLPFRVWWRLAGSMTALRPTGSSTSAVPVDRLTRAVRTMFPYVPKASCLTQALTAQTLLARHGYASRLRIGVAPGQGIPLDAHAWVQIDERVVIGNRPNLTTYAVLPAFELNNRPSIAPPLQNV